MHGGQGPSWQESLQVWIPQEAIFLQGPPQIGIGSAQDSLKLPPVRVNSEILPQGQVSTSSGSSLHSSHGPEWQFWRHLWLPHERVLLQGLLQEENYSPQILCLVYFSQ